MEYSYGYDAYDMDMIMDTLGSTLIGSGVFGALLALAFFIFTAVALYTIARRRGIDHAWMAWVPVLNCWTLGCISDQYQYLVKGKNKKRRTVLLVLGIISTVLGILFLGSYLVLIVNVFREILNGANEAEVADRLVMKMIGPTMVMVLSMLPYLGVGIAYTVFHYIALNDLYKSCAPKDGTVYLVLSILINVTEPFFLFACRNKDEGMPPRRTCP